MTYCLYQLGCARVTKHVSGPGIARLDTLAIQLQKHAMHRAVGIDFGTTNSAIAVSDPRGQVTLAHFDADGRVSETFRSVLYFEQHKEGLRRTISSFAGPDAISRYLAADHKGRFIQSLKS